MGDAGIPIWGVSGLSDHEQRQVRGGVAPKGGRTDCVRGAMQNYVNSIRNGTPRASARQTMLNEIANCGSGGSDT